MSIEKSLVNFLGHLLEVEADSSKIIEAGDEFDELIEDNINENDLNHKTKDELLKYLSCLIKYRSALFYSHLNDDNKFDLILEFVVEAAINKDATWSEIMPALSTIDIEKQLKIEALILKKKKEELEKQLQQLNEERKKVMEVKKHELESKEANDQYAVMGNPHDIGFFKGIDEDAKEENEERTIDYPPQLNPIIQAMNKLQTQINFFERKREGIFTFRPELLEEKAKILKKLKDRFEVIQAKSKIDKHYSKDQAEQDIKSYLEFWESAYKKVIEKHRLPFLLRIFSREKRTGTQKVVESLKEILHLSGKP